MHIAIALLTAFQAATFQPARKDALEIIREQEQKVRSASFTQEWVEMIVTSDGQIWHPSRFWGRSEGVISSDEFVRMKYRLIDNSQSRSGRPGFNIDTRDCAVDRGEYRVLEYLIRPSETSPLKPAFGRISGEMEAWDFENVCGVSCLSLVPAFYRGVGLSHYLEKIPLGTPAWQVLPSESESILRIWHPDARTSDDQFTAGFLLNLDLSKNGLITSIGWHFGLPGDDTFEKDAGAAVVDLELVELDGFWLPKSCMYGYFYTLERSGERRCSMATRQTIEWSDINEPVGEEALLLEFPAGLPVSTPLERKGWELYRFFEDNLHYARHLARTHGGYGYAMAIIFYLLVFVVVVLGPLALVLRWRHRRAPRAPARENDG
jgi:hypothetical protein